VATKTTKLTTPETAAAPLQVTSMTALVRAVLNRQKTSYPQLKLKDFLRTYAGFLALYRNRGQSSDLAFKLAATRGHGLSLRYGKFSSI
jgi:hypothetical protein